MSDLNTQNNQEDVNLLELIQVILDHAKSIAIATIIIGVSSAIYISTVERTYVAKALIKSSSKVGSTGESNASGLAGLLGIQASANLAASDTDMDSTMAIMNSREFLEKFIVNHDLKKAIFEDDWDQKEKSWIKEEPILTEAYKTLKKAIKITFDPVAFTRRQIGYAEIEVKWKDPEIAAYIANNLPPDINLYLSTQMIAESERSIIFLDEQFIKTNVLTVRESLSKLKTEQIRNMMLANVSKDFAVRIIDDALVPEFPESPKRVQFVMIATALGFVASIIIVFLNISVFPLIRKLKLPF